MLSCQALSSELCPSNITVTPQPAVCPFVCLFVSVSFIEVLLQVCCQGQEDQEQACAKPQQDGCSAAGGGNAAQAEPGVPGWLNVVCAFATVITVLGLGAWSQLQAMCSTHCAASRNDGGHLVLVQDVTTPDTLARSLNPECLCGPSTSCCRLCADCNVRHHAYVRHHIE